jgi:NTE family protein
MEKVLSKYIKQERIEDLPIPFFVTVANLLTGEVEYKDKGELIPYVQASSSIPVLFSPVEIDGIPYVDGGLVDNLPVAPLEDCCEHIIGVSISPVQRVEEVENLIQIAARTFQISVNSQLNKIREKCDTFIQPDGLAEFGLLDTSKAEELFELGYNYTMEQVDWQAIPRKEDA